MTLGQILAAVLLAMAITAAGTWQVQENRYGKKLADIDRDQALAITEAGNAARKEEQRRQAKVNVSAP